MVNEKQTQAIDIATASPRDPCAQLFGSSESEVLQMEASSEPKIQTKKKELMKLTNRMDGREWKKVQTTSTPQKTKLKKAGKPTVTKRIKQLKSVTRTHKEAKRT